MMKLTINGYKNKIENKYYRIYVSLIEKRLKTPIDKTIYHENHHILPSCLGGTDDKDNLIPLLPREHYIAHLCLVKFITGNGYYKMLCAINAMTLKTLKYSKYNNRLYDILSNKRSKQLSVWLKTNSPFKDKKIHQKTIDTREKNKSNIWITNNPMKNPIKAKEIASKRSGKNHYLTKKTKYEYSLDFGNTWITIDNNLTIKEICNIMHWNSATFHYILNGKIPKRGNMKNLMLRKFYNENITN